MRRDAEKARAWEQRSRERALQRQREKPLPRSSLPASPAPESSAPPKKRKRLRRSGDPEKRRARSEQQYGEEAFRSWLHSLPCFVPGCSRRPIQAVHVRSRGAGGDWSDQIPGCAHHHDRLHKLGIKSFEREVGFSLAAVAETVHNWWLQRKAGLL